MTITLATVRDAEFAAMRDVTYLNNASIGPLPERTRRLLAAFNDRRAAPHTLLDEDNVLGLPKARAAVARLIGATPQEIGLTSNTTYGINVAAGGLPIRSGETVIVSEREFPANVYPWLRLKARGVNVELIPTTSAGWPDEARLLERLRDPNVRVLAVSHVQFSSGYRVDLAALSAACRANGTFLVVDAIQALGHVPFSVKETPVDVLACGAQKWLLGPWGAGFVYVRKEILGRIEPAVVGWMAFEGTDDFTRLTEYRPQLHADARRAEVATVPYQDIRAMVEGLGLLEELGISRIAEHTRRLKAPLVEAARKGHLAIVSPTDEGHSCSIVCIKVPEVEAAFQRLKDHNVICSLREGAIRLSPHCYNTMEEMERVVDVLAD
jgi:selenocysteine lyase/cysteine desulfurase